MYKNQLQELAQRSCFNLPAYTCIREGPDHAPRFKATVNFNGETFESPHYYTTLRQAEHAAAEVARNSLSNRGPSHSLAARILDETGVYKNLLQEISQRVGAPLPQYTTLRSGLGHQPIFTGMVELAGITFTGEPAKNKKQAEKSAAMAAWTSLKHLAQQDAISSSETENSEELEQVKIARALLNCRLKEKMGMANSSSTARPFKMKFQIWNSRPPSPQPRPITASKILPLICQQATPQIRPTSRNSPSQVQPPFSQMTTEGHLICSQKFRAAGGASYAPTGRCKTTYRGIALPVTVRSVVPVFSAPILPRPNTCSSQFMPPNPPRMAPPVSIRHDVPVSAAPPAQKEEPPTLVDPVPTHRSPVCVDESANKGCNNHPPGPEALQLTEQLKI
ncbi:hypothetical protein NMG60_11033172 [Bertholletia excelsa]